MTFTVQKDVRERHAPSPALRPRGRASTATGKRAACVRQAALLYPGQAVLVNALPSPVHMLSAPRRRVRLIPEQPAEQAFAAWFSSRYVSFAAVAVWTAPSLPPMRMILYRNGDFSYFTSMGVACTVLSADSEGPG